MAEIYSLVYKPADENAPDHYTRVPLKEAHLVKGHGIEGDLSGRPRRQLNVNSFETIKALGDEGFKANPGELGEQIVIRGLDVNTLPTGTRLQLGADAVIEVQKPRTGCERFEAIQGRPPTDAKGRLGVMARVVHTGIVQVGDPVTVLEAVAG